jgi:hypothetical protein
MRTTQAGFKSGRGSEGPADLLKRLGPTVLVDIGLKSRAAPGEPPDLPLKRVRALIDTGADGECIDEELAETLGLAPSERGFISGISGQQAATIYTARIYVPSLDRLLFQRFAGVKLREGDQWHRVILGRAFLRQYRMIYDGGTGAVEIVEA